MTQIQAKKFAQKNTQIYQSAEQKLAQIANFLKLNINNTIGKLKQKFSPWMEPSASSNQRLPGNISLSEAKGRDLLITQGFAGMIQKSPNHPY